MDPLIDGIAGNAGWALIKRALLIPITLMGRRLQKNSPFKQVVVCLKHRINAHETYYEEAFASGQDVLYVSIMSHNTIKEDMEIYVNVAEKSRTHLRVLTWNPSDNYSIESFRKHLDENNETPHLAIDQVRQASIDWDNLASKHQNIVIRKYQSSPTMQGIIVNNEWALIELIPYNTKPKERPALILTQKTDPEVFNFFSERFERLWDAAK